jgi:hypothetical protein
MGKTRFYISTSKRLCGYCKTTNIKIDLDFFREVSFWEYTWYIVKHLFPFNILIGD